MFFTEGVTILGFSLENKWQQILACIKERGAVMNWTMLNEFVSGMIDVLGDAVEEIVLYGSVAKGTNTEESDIDIALLIKLPLNKELEEQLSDFVVDMNLKYDTVFSVIDIDYQNFKKWESTLPFYRNVKQEGIVLWKAA